MPYRFQPQWAYITVHALRVLAYVAIAVAGVGAFMYSPDVLNTDLTYILAQLWGYMTFMSAIVASIGVMYREYRIEMVVLPFMITGMMIYFVTLTASVIAFGGSFTYLALIVTLCIVIILRLVELLAHSFNLRKQHKERTRT